MPLRVRGRWHAALRLLAACCYAALAALAGDAAAAAQGAGAGAPCAAPPDFRYEALARVHEPGHATATLLRHVCMVQEVLVLYDMQLLQGGHAPHVDVAHLHPHHDPRALLGGARGHAVPGAEPVATAAAAAAAASSVAGHVTGAEAAGASSRAGGHHPLPQSQYELVLRYPHAAELSPPPQFSRCTVPLLIHQSHLSRWEDFLVRAPAYLHRYQVKQGLLDARVSLVVATPWKLDLDPWVTDLLRPYTRYQVTSFHEFSNLHLPDTPSNATAEGVAQQCFERVLLAQFDRPNLAGAWPAAQLAVQHQAPAARRSNRAQAQALWRSQGPELLRVLLAVRPCNATRQFLKLDSFLQACSAQQVLALADGSSVAVQCMVHELGGIRGPPLNDGLKLLRQADVLVALHGAGETNALFMRQGASLLEVRQREMGTTYQRHANAWGAALAREGRFQFHWYGLNVEDGQLSLPSASELQGRATGLVAARDRHVVLCWQDVLPALQVIAKVGPDEAAYADAVRGRRHLWQVEQGGRLRLVEEADMLAMERQQE